MAGRISRLRVSSTLPNPTKNATKSAGNLAVLGAECSFARFCQRIGAAVVEQHGSLRDPQRRQFALKGAIKTV